MRRDFEDYLLKVQKQRDEMAKAVEEANSLILEGKIEESQVQAIQTYFNTLEANYQRILYCKYLYTLPPKFIQKIQQKKLVEELKKFLDKHADKDSVFGENQEWIEATEAIVEEAKNG